MRTLGPTFFSHITVHSASLSLETKAEYFMEIYSLEAAVQAFFSTQISPTRQESDELASTLLGGDPVVPFAIQGQFSYTVFSPGRIKASESDHAESSDKYSNAKIVQFRLPESKINVCLAQCAKKIHGHLAAETYYHGEIGHSTHRLAIYVIEKLPGVAYIEMGNFSAKMDTDRAMRQFRMIEDFARYLAYLLSRRSFPRALWLMCWRTLAFWEPVGSTRNRFHKDSKRILKHSYPTRSPSSDLPYPLASTQSSLVCKETFIMSSPLGFLRFSHTEIFLQRTYLSPRLLVVLRASSTGQRRKSCRSGWLYMG